MSSACLPDLLAKEQAENALWWNTVFLGVDLLFSGLATPHMVSDLTRASRARRGVRLPAERSLPMTDGEIAYQAKQLQSLTDKLDDPFPLRSSIFRNMKSRFRKTLAKRAIQKMRD